LRRRIKTNFLVEKFLRWKARYFFKGEPISFSKTLREAQKVLIFLPHKVESFSSAANHLPAISEIFYTSKIFLLMPFEGGGFLSSLGSFEIIRIDVQDLKWLSLPKDKFIQKIRSYNFDISLDLDLEKNFLNAYLSLLSGSKLRIGVNKDKEEPFYNLELAISESGSFQDESYDSLVQILRNLKSGHQED
jgi:hypothetical protein